MSHMAKVIFRGSAQEVHLPDAYRFEGTEVFIRRDPTTGDVILSRKPGDWNDFFAALNGTEIPADFLSKEERQL